MSTTSLTAGEVMNRVASLMNDTARSSYTYAAQIPYLNMAIDDLMEEMELSEVDNTEKTASVITLPIGDYQITPIESATLPHYPTDLVEIVGLGERLSGSDDVFISMSKKDFIRTREATESLLEWTWENQIIKFNPNGATTEREIELQYLAAVIAQATDENSIIGIIGAKSYLAFKAGKYCAMFIGENPERAQALELEAEDALGRFLGLSAKGNQAVFTRRRPFRANYKSRGM